ncbi:MAG: hypothetical protein OEO82_02255 [Gammaproteobacteria bacterium]|nr:hypothetical protein [Gammaproteobacteria bacterium]
MTNSRRFVLTACTLAIASISFNGTASAQSILQVLDTVTVTGKDFAIGLNENEPPGFDELVNDPAANFVDCESNTATGLICLDGDDVRIWPNLSNPTTSSVLFNCGNPALPFNTRRDNGCTAVARDLAGNIYLGGRLNGTANVVIKVFEDPEPDVPTNGSACGTSTPFVDMTDGTNYLCFDELATGRPRVEDIDVLEGDDKRLLVLEEKKTALVYSNFEPDPGATQVDELASGKNDFNLVGNEQVLNAVLMEYVRPTDESNPALLRQGESDIILLVATDRGRLIAVDNFVAPNGVEVFDLTLYRTQPVCLPTEDDSFDITTSANSNLAYATDRNHCSLHVLESVAAANGDFDGFQPATGSPLSTSITATASLTTTFYQPLEVSVSPGIGFDLRDCFPFCDLIGAGAARLEFAQSVGANSGVTLYQVVGIPHCAWIPQTCYEILTGIPTIDRDLAVTYLIGEDVLRNLDPPVPPRVGSTPPPEGLIYNVVPLLPDEVTNRYQLLADFLAEGTNGLPVLPPLLFPPEYRAQKFAFQEDGTQIDKGFIFNALFFVPEPGVETDGVLTLEVDVQELTPERAELGCDLVGGLPTGYDLRDLLNWDVTVRASERWRSASGLFDPPADTPVPPEAATYQGSISNAGCRNPTRSRTGGISIFPFDFEVTLCPLTRNMGNTAWVSDGVCVIDGLDTTPEMPDDAVFAKLYVKLYDELLAHLQELACTNTDTGATTGTGDPFPPLSPSECASLEATWLNGKDKLVKALAATFEPKSSSGNENFGAVQSQLQNYSNSVQSAEAFPYGPDPANRVGEQAARVETLQHILVDKLLPSIPDTGFDDVDRTWAE